MFDLVVRVQRSSIIDQKREEAFSFCSLDNELLFAYTSIAVGKHVFLVRSMNYRGRNSYAKEDRN